MAAWAARLIGRLRRPPRHTHEFTQFVGYWRCEGWMAFVWRCVHCGAEAVETFDDH